MATKYKTVNEFISLGEKTAVSYDNTSFKEPLKDISFTIHNIIYDYVNELKTFAYTVTLSDKEFLRYKYKPKLLANDLYGNGEYYFIILAINGIADVKNFDQKTLLLLKKETMLDCISKIFNAEKNNIDIYNRKNG